MSDVNDDPIAAIEQGLTGVVRQANLPRAHARFAAAAGVPLLDKSAYFVLGRIGDEGPMRLSELADALGVEPSTVSRQVSELERAGFVERRTDERDARASRLFLTRSGQRTLANLRRARRELITELVADWTAEERTTLARLLPKLADSLAARAGREVTAHALQP